MRIALVSDCYVPTRNGVTGVLGALRTGLADRGHEVLLLAPAPWRRGGVAQSDEALPAADHAIASAPLVPSIDLRLPLPRPGEVAASLSRFRPHVVHTHTEGVLGLAARTFARRSGRPLVHTLHTFYEHYRHYVPLPALPGGRDERVLAAFLRRFLAPYDAVVGPSAAAVDVAAASGVPGVLVPNAVADAPPPPDPVTRSQLRARLGVPAGAGLLVTVGRIAPEKRSRELVDAFLSRSQTSMNGSPRPGAVLLLLGGGPDLPRLRRRVRTCGAADRVRLPGVVAPREVRQVLGLADVYVSASVGENHPLALLEAAAAGLPIAARRDPNLGDVVVEGHNAEVADDDHALVERALALLTDAPRRARRAAASRQVAGRFDLAGHLARTEAVYEELAGRQRT